jgi:hypothetical protein
MFIMLSGVRSSSCSCSRLGGIFGLSMYVFTFAVLFSWKSWGIVSAAAEMLSSGSSVTWKVQYIGSDNNAECRSCETCAPRAVISSNVLSIDYGAFAMCSGLLSVTIPQDSRLEKISDYAFYGSASLNYVKLAALTLHSIGDFAFAESGLRQLVLSNSASIGSYAFSNCLDLESVTFIGNVLPELADANENVAIGNSAFQGCVNLTRFDFPFNVASIGLHAFRLTGLKTVELPTRLRQLEDGAFASCSSLTSVQINEGLKRLSSQLFFKCTRLREVVFSSTVEEIGLEAFANTGVSAFVSFPPSLSSVGAGAFSHCSSLQYVDFSKTKVEVIPAKLFSGDVALYNVILNSKTATPGSASVPIISCELTFSSRSTTSFAHSTSASSLLERSVITKWTVNTFVLTWSQRVFTDPGNCSVILLTLFLLQLRLYIEQTCSERSQQVSLLFLQNLGRSILHQLDSR